MRIQKIPGDAVRVRRYKCKTARFICAGGVEPRPYAGLEDFARSPMVHLFLRMPAAQSLSRLRRQLPLHKGALRRRASFVRSKRVTAQKQGRFPSSVTFGDSYPYPLCPFGTFPPDRGNLPHMGKALEGTFQTVTLYSRLLMLAVISRIVSFTGLRRSSSAASIFFSE